MKLKVYLMLALFMGCSKLTAQTKWESLTSHSKYALAYYEIRQNGKTIAIERKTGGYIIPQSRGYDDISFWSMLDEKGIEGYFKVEKNGLKGACDITGKEIIPCRYTGILYSPIEDDQGFTVQNSSGDWEDLNIMLEESGKSYKKVIDEKALTSRECKVENDGFEWYKITKKEKYSDKYGAEDRYGNVLLPTAFSSIDYQPLEEYSWGTSGCGFMVDNGTIAGHKAYYLRNGKCIIPFTRKYTYISKSTEDKFGTYYNCSSWGGEKTICDSKGKVIVSVNEGKPSIRPVYNHGIFYFSITRYSPEIGHGIIDANGKTIVEPKYEKDISLSKDGRSFGYTDSAGKWVSLALVTTMSTKLNPFANNPKEDPEATTLVATPQPSNRTPVSNHTGNSGNTQTTSNSQTQTIVVEHHRDPVPMQEWQACWACGGMGTMGCDNCGGSGTKYIGDRLHRCSRCNGGGIIPCNICHGNKGQYITVYR